MEVQLRCGSLPVLGVCGTCTCKEERQHVVIESDLYAGGYCYDEDCAGSILP